jgi:hypothetical protein
MKILSLVLATFLFLLTRTFAADHLVVQGCDLFISKVMASSGPFDSGYVNLFLKFDQRLSGQIQEVGFKYKEITTANGSHSQRKSGNLKAVKNNDIYHISLPVTYQYGKITYSGYFYLRTNKATYYLKTNEEREFLIDEFTYSWLTETAGFRPILTSSHQGQYFNSRSCF